MVVLVLKTIETHHHLEWDLTWPFGAKFDDALGQKTVGCDVDPERFEISNCQLGDLKQILPNKGFTASESYTIHARQLLEDCFDFLNLQVVMALEFP
jgi:hypothetical protein